MVNHYDILGVKSNATFQEIKKAYKRLAVLHHPDKNQGDAKAEETFKQVVEAYHVLSSARRRMDYDRVLGVKQQTLDQYRYHEGGLYRSMFQHSSSPQKDFRSPEVFQSKKKDIDFYLFWVCLGMTLLLAAFFLFFTK